MIAVSAGFSNSKGSRDRREVNFYISSRCTPDHPCTHGEGHCTSNSDCERNGYHICGAACIGFFPSICSPSLELFCSGPTFDTENFPNNTDIKYSPSDMCCVRRSNFCILCFVFVHVCCVRRSNFYILYLYICAVFKVFLIKD